MQTNVGEDPSPHKPAETSAVAEDPDRRKHVRPPSVGMTCATATSPSSSRDRTCPRVTDPEFPDLHKAAQGEYVLVKMTVKNVGADPQMFFASFNTLSDGTTEYQADDEAWIYLGNTLADLSPGDAIDTAVVFDVPVGTDPESVELHDGPFSEGVTVGL